VIAHRRPATAAGDGLSVLAILLSRRVAGTVLDPHLVPPAASTAAGASAYDARKCLVGCAVAAYNAATMDLTMQLDLGDLRLRTLLKDDAELLVEATRHERAPALWGPRPAGPYSLDDARSALQEWDPARGKRASYGVLRADRLVAALGLMVDGPQSAELAYWVRPEQRRRGIGLRSVHALTAWAHRGGGLARLWLEIEPGNTASLRLAGRAGYQLEQRLPRHCRSWIDDDPDRDTWHDCLIFTDVLEGPREQ
jgi:RimJ/RimL family protein N-acetyltransferase